MNKKSLKLTLVISLALAALVSQSAQADTKTWRSSNGSWDNDSNWLPFGVPGSGDGVIVSPYGGVNTVLNFTSATGNRSADSLLINSETASIISFLQSGGNLTISSEIVVYGYHRGNYVLSGGNLSAAVEVIGESYYMGFPLNNYGVFTQTGGTNTVTNLTISRPGSRGEYNLSGGNLLAGDEVVGVGETDGPGNTGIFTQSGGIHTVNNELSIGVRGSGTYTLQAGSLSTKSESIGSGLIPIDSSSGNFIQNGGTHTVSDILSIGIGVNGYGIYNLNAGSLSAHSESIGTFNNNYLYYEGSSTGIFTQNGGTHTVSDILSIGFGGFGTYNLSAGSLLTNSESLGSSFYHHPVHHPVPVSAVSSGTGNFVQSGGTHMVSKNLSIGSGMESTGKYDLSAGSLSAGSEDISYLGTFNQTGGTNTVETMTNKGAYNLTGGTLIINGNLENSGALILTGGAATVSGSVNNAASGKIEVAHSPAIFTGDVVNNGQFKSTHATVTFTGSYTENGAYISDPSVNNFNNLIVGTNGYLVGGTGDEWHITGNFENHSLQNVLWNTADASLFFDGSGIKNLYLAGADHGLSLLGFADNFAFGSLHLASGAELNIFDGNVTPGAAMYVELLNLADGINQLSSIHSDYNIYYNASLAGNAYLMDRTYALDGGGVLAPAIPEPETYAMLLAGLGLIGFMARRRKISAT